MTQEMDVDSVVRLRIRGLRKAKGWSLESLATRARMSVSTLSRLETGNRRMALDQLVPLAQALDTTLDELVAPPAEQDALIRPEPVSVPGLTTWRLSEPDGLHGSMVVKMRIDPREGGSEPEPRVHPGKDWFTVLRGEVKLRLGERVYHVKAGQAAQFDTMTPHSFWAVGGVAELLSILDTTGQQIHCSHGDV